MLQQFAPCPVLPLLGEGRSRKGEGRKAALLSLLVEALLALPLRDSRDSGVQIGELVNSGWKSMLEGAVLGSQAPGGEGKRRISVLQGECVGPQPCNNRPLLKEARWAGQQQRRTSSQIPPPMVLHFPRIPLLLESTSSCLGRYFSSDSSHIAELPVTIYHSYRGLHQCNRIENTTLGLQQLHNNAPSPISTTAKCTVRGINSHIWSNPS